MLLFAVERALGEKECPVSLLNTGHRLKLISLSGAHKRYRYMHVRDKKGPETRLVFTLSIIICSYVLYM